MIQIYTITNNPFSENTYILADETKKCIIIDPGMYSASEEIYFKKIITENQLIPEAIWLTHAHVDHVMGLKYAMDTYGISYYMHTEELGVLKAVPSILKLYNLNEKEIPEPNYYFDENKSIKFGNQTFEIFHTPGHSPGSVSFYNAKNNFLISGDVLFRQSIGRTDLPGGNFETLERSIKEKLYILPDVTKVYSGHGPETTIGFEKINNSFVKM